MPLVPLAPPITVPVVSGFDYVTVDAARRRVYAAHTGSRALAIFDADSGAVVGQVRVGPMHGVAVDPATGHVFTGNGEARTVSEVDPVAKRVLRSVDVSGAVDAVVYDAATKRIYADEGDGPHVFVIDATTMRLVATVTMPAEHLEYLAIDPQTHDVYQNLADKDAFAIVDGSTLGLRKVVPTPGITRNHPLQFDAAYGEILTGGGGMLAAFDRGGKELGSTTLASADQCDLDQSSHVLACAGGGFITVFRARPNAAPEQIAQLAVARGAHTVAVDGKTGDVWTAWGSPQGDFVQRFALR